MSQLDSIISTNSLFKVLKHILGGGGWYSYSDLHPFLPLPDIKIETETEEMRAVERR
jgi:hypothetical protein